MTAAVSPSPTTEARTSIMLLPHPVGPGGAGSRIRSHYLSRAILAEFPRAIVVHRSRDVGAVFERGPLNRCSGLVAQSLRRIPTPVFLEGLPSSPALARALMALLKSSRRATRLVLDLHDDVLLKGEFVPPTQLTAPNGYRELRDFMLRSCDVAFFPSKSMLTYFARRLELDQARLCVLPNASDPSHFRVAPIPEAKVIGLVSGLAPGRGLKLLLESFRMVLREEPHAVLRIAIPGQRDPEFHNVGRWTDGGALPNVEFVPGVTYSAVPDFLSTCRLTVIPHPRNVYMDFATPIKLFDTMAAARPCVSTDCTETAAIMRSEDAGIAVEASPRAFSEAILWMLRERDQATRMGLNGRRAIMREHNWNSRGALLCQTMRSLTTT